MVTTITVNIETEGTLYKLDVSNGNFPTITTYDQNEK